MSVQKIDVKLIIPTPANPRGPVDPKSPYIQEMAESMRLTGQLQNGVARPHPTQPGHYDLRVGACRLAAIIEAGLPTMDLAVREMTDKEAMTVTVQENLQRRDLSPMQEAAGIQGMLAVGHDFASIAAETGKTVAWLKRRAQLTKLSDAWKAAAAKHQIPAGILELVARYDAEVQEDLYDHYVRNQWQLQQLLSPGGAEDMEQHLAARTHELRLAPWKLEDDLLVPLAGACAQCPKRSSCNPELFAEFAAGKGKKSGGDRCLDPACWNEKFKAHTRANLERIRAKYPTVIKVSTADYSPGRGILGREDFTVAKEGTKGAVPALDAGSDDALIWVVPRNTKEGAKAKAKAAGEPAQSLEEKRAGLRKRRIAHVLDRLAKDLQAQKDLPAIAHYTTAQGLVELVAVFETGFFIGHHGADQFPGTNGWQALAKAKKDPKKALLVVWQLVCPKLAETLAYYTTGNIVDEHEEAARQIASLLGLKYADLLAEAEREIPEPKAWAKLK